MRMLLLEDDERVARGIVRITLALGHEAVWTRTLAESRKVLQELPIDVILADVGLDEGESGLDLLDHARTTYPHIRRALTSGAIRPAGFVVNPPTQVFLNKPFGRAELVTLLQDNTGT
jgi:DNA-binding response OmpR family regulator